MKRKIWLFNVVFAALVLLAGTTSALAAVEVTVGSATVSPGATGFTVDVTLNNEAPAIRGVEINIGYDAGTLTFKQGVPVDGTWFITNIATVAVDGTNTQSGQLKILLSALSTGIAANTAATLARLTFDISAAASELSYPIVHLSSSPGLRDTSLQAVAYTATNGNAFVTGIPTGAITLTPDPASIAADGTSTSTITSSAIKDAGASNVPDGTKITVTTTAGTITTADADGTIAGTQVLTSSGVINFTLQSATTAGSANINATSVAGDASGGTSVTFAAGAVGAGNSTVAVDKASTSVGTGAGDGITVTVTLKDGNNNLIQGTEVFLSITGSDNYINGPTVGNGPTSIGVTDASGVATGVIKSTKAEGKTISARGGATTITQTQAVTYTPGPAATLTVTGVADPVTAGAAANVVVTALDEFGNVATGYTGTIAFTSSDAQAVLPADYTFVAGDNGTKTFASGVTLKTAGDQSVTATDTVTGTITGSQTGITVNAAAANTLTVAGITDPVVAGTASNVVITALDEFGNVATLYTGTIAFTSTDAQAVLPANYTFVAGDSGTKTFTGGVTLKTVGEQTVTATDTVTGSITGAQTAITVTPAAATKLTVAGITDPVTAGVASDVVVTARDDFNNVATGYVGTIAFTSTDPQAVLPANYTFVAGDSGTKTFTGGVTLKTVGEQTVTATDTVTGAITGAQSEITVNAAAAAKVGLTANKTTLASDQKGSATLTARLLDSFGNLVATDGVTINLVISDSTYVVLDNAAPTTAAGVATATITTKAGTIPSPPATTNVTAQSAGLTDSDPVAFMLVNFSIQVNTPAAPFVDVTGVHLVTSASTPTTATFVGVGGTSGQYQWALAGVGTIDSTTADTITYTAPATITGASQTGTLTLTSASDGALTDTITITVYNPVAVTWPTAAVGIATGDNTKVVTASGGTGTYKFESSDVTKATVNADTGAITPVAAGTITVKVRDATYGDFAVVNGFLAVTPNIQIVAPIVVSGPAAVDTAGTATYICTGGTGAVNWTADSGSITAAGVFTAPAVASGSVTVKITATDQVYSDIKDEYTVTVFGSAAIKEIQEKFPDYVDGQPLTYPKLTSGLTLTLSAVDATRNYDWVVTDWDGNVVDDQTTGASTFVLDPDDLFAASGAGVYTVTLTDKDNPDLAPATLKVRVPMQFFSTKYDPADSGTYTAPPDASDTYFVEGGPAANVYMYAIYDLAGALVADGVYGTFTDASPTNEDNVFTFAAGLTSLTSYRVKVSLDATSADPDAARLIAAGLGEVWSGIFRIVPVVTFAGVVLEVDEVTPIAGATVTATFDPTLTDTTIADGSFSIPGIELTGATYSFVVAKTGYIDKIVSGTEIPDDAEIILEPLGTGGTISGTVALSDDPVPYASGTVQVKAKTALGAYVQDSEGFDIVVLANATTGAYTFPIPADFTAMGPFDLEFTKSGYIFDEAAGLGVLTGVALAAPNADITLYPSTVISIAATPQDTSAPADGVFDQVLVTITAEAGLAPARFDGTATEIEVRDASNNVITLDAFASAGANTWSFTHTAYENFTITVDADVSEDRDVDADYKATTTYSYVKSADQNETVIANPSTTGGTATSPSGDNEVTIPPGGLTGDILGSVTVVIVESDAGEAGATAITGSEILEVYLVDQSGNRVTSGNIARIEIKLKFDPTVVTPGTLENGTYVIYQAATVNDLIAGNATPVPASQIVPEVDYTNGFVTFWVDHLSAFGIGPAPAAQGGGGGGGGGGCFIDTMTGPSAPGWFAPLILMALAAGAWFVRRAAK